MTQSEIFAYLQTSFPDAGLVLDETQPEPLIVVPREQLLDVARLLNADEQLHFECLMCLTSIDMGEELHAVYNLYSMKHDHKCTLRCRVNREDPVIPSVSSVWATADWHEREAYDLMGITFEGHPDPRRILLPDDWEGHPLRKDYQPQKEWHGIPLEAVQPEDLEKKRENG